MSRHSKYIEMAVTIAKKSKCRFKIGAVLVYRGQVTALSPNILLQPAEADNFRHSSLHAEEGILRKRKSTKGRKIIHSSYR